MKVSENTLSKFMVSKFCIKDYEHWVLLTRISQSALGSLILLNKDGADNFGTLSESALLEMGRVINELEKKLKQAFNYDKINYQMLRMADPEVHFHIIPRYSEPKIFNNKEFLDQNWPGPFALNNENNLTENELMELHKFLVKLFNN